jgi:hypothetical protein
MTDVYFVALAFHLIDFAISERRRILHYSGSDPIFRYVFSAGPYSLIRLTESYVGLKSTGSGQS